MFPAEPSLFDPRSRGQRVYGVSDDKSRRRRLTALNVEFLSKMRSADTNTLLLLTAIVKSVLEVPGIFLVPIQGWRRKSRQLMFLS
jgi:hypothetical protein